MKTIAILTRRQDAAPEAIQRLVQQELQVLWRGMAAGTVRGVHGLAGSQGAVLELETATESDARTYIDTLPFVIENLLIVQLIALKPFPAFAELGMPPPAEPG